MMRSTLNARGVHAARASVISVSPDVRTLIRTVSQCWGKASHDNKNRLRFAKQHWNNTDSEVFAGPRYARRGRPASTVNSKSRKRVPAAHHVVKCGKDL